MILGIKAEVTLPVMAKARIGHFVEAQVLQALEVDFIDESEVLTIADEECHIDKTGFSVPFVCGCRDLGEGLRRIAEGAAMLRSKGEAGTGNIVEAVRHARSVQRSIRQLGAMDEAELYGYAKTISAPLELVKETRRLGRLPVVMFAAGGIATPADAALMMQLGVDGVFVGSGIFKSGDPVARGKAIVAATTHYNNPKVRAAGSGGAPPRGARASARTAAAATAGVVAPPPPTQASLPVCAHTRPPHLAQVIAEVSTGLGDAMSGTGNIKESQVAFRERGL